MATLLTLAGATSSVSPDAGQSILSDSQIRTAVGGDYTAVIIGSIALVYGTAATAKNAGISALYGADAYGDCLISTVVPGVDSVGYA